MKKLIIGGVVVLTLAIIVTIIGVSASNKEIRLRSQIEAQTQVLESYLDKMWKVISQKAQIAEQYKEAFAEIYPDLIEGRYGNERGGTLMKWITESNPDFDVTLYQELARSVEAERAGFFMEQELLIDLANEHRILLQTFPSNMFVGGREQIEIIVISSDHTQEIMETGIDNNIELFPEQ